MEKKKLFTILIVGILITSSFIFIIKTDKKIEEKKDAAKYTKPNFITSNEVNSTGMLIDVDYDEIESQLKTYNDTTDLDGDGVDDIYEETMGFDPYVPDSDGDGLNDYDELLYGTNPLSFDTDSDGLSDGVEIFNYSTNATLIDSDGDGLFDGEEIIAGTNPLNSDSDGDGVSDGDEVDWNEDVDLDGKINALDSDSDGDRLNDYKELYIYKTNMIVQDTDKDLIDDYYESEIYDTDPLLSDTDSDGLIDGVESYSSYFLKARSYLAEGNSYVVIDGKRAGIPTITGDIISFGGKIRSGTYKLMIFAKVYSFDFSKNDKPKLYAEITGSNGCVSKTETLFLPVLSDADNNLFTEFRWVSTSKFTLNADCRLDIDISMVDYVDTESIAIEKFALLNMDDLTASFTDPVTSDSDNDGIPDGNEASEDAYWFEAEDFVFDEEHVLNDFNASNGKLFSTTHLALADPTTIITIDTETNVSEGFYSLFVKGYSSHWSMLDVKITYYEDGVEKAISGTYEMDGTFPRGMWTAVYFSGDDENVKLEISNPSKVIIDISTIESSKADPLSIDKIVFVKMTYKKPTSEFASQLPGLVPRLLTDPMDPDTDGDQYRSEFGADNGEDCDTCASMLSLNGYLTDDFELDNGMNPMSIDSDSDFVADDVDPNPLGRDADDDGIPDFFEDTYPEDMPDGVYQSDNETTDWCNPDTDRDRVIDGNEDWDYDTVVDDGETNPGNPDTDGDGLLDGGKDESPVLLEGLEHTYTTNVGSAQYNYLSSSLSKINNSGVFYDPWFVNTDGTATFIGEIDKGTDPNDVDSDDDLISDGVEVFVYGTNPAKQDTDGDGFTDYEEINEMGTDPLVADWPDLTINSITMDPDTPTLDWWNQTRNGIFIVEVENIGLIDAVGNIEIQFTSNGITLYNIVRDLAAGERKEVKFYYYAVVAEFFDTYYSQHGYKIIYQPGKFTATAKIETKNPDKNYNDKISETDWNNNDFSINLTVKGAKPVAYLTTNYNLNLITAGENITFSYRGWDPDGGVTKYELDFEGDGIWDYTDTKDGVINHTFLETSYNGTERDTFTAVLKVTDTDNKTGIDYSKEISVMPSLSDDSDGDGLTNEEEIYTYGTNTMDADFDQDSLNDYQEVIIYKTDPFKADSDNDGIRDDREIYVAGFFGLNATDDADGDGLPNNLDADSDNDGIKDGTEYKFTRPDTLDPVSIQIQSHYNWHGTNPFNSDTDFDGISDAAEEGIVVWGALSRPYLHLSSKRADTDNDGLNDYEEVYVFASDANNQDTDRDGLPDGIDLQPLTEVVQMNTVEEEFINSHCRTVDDEKGIRWTKYYPKHMLQYDTEIYLMGIDGNSWEIWGADENLGNEGVMDSYLGASSLDEIGYGDYSIFDYEMRTNDNIRFGHSTTTYDGLRHYKIKYELEGRGYDISLWNHKITEHPNYLYYTAWETGLEPGYNNSIEMQFKILNSYDKYNIYDEDNLHIPAFIYKVFKKGSNGLQLKTNSQYHDDKYLYYNGDPVYTGLSQATAISGNEHWYNAELRIPKEYVTSENMFVVITPIWQNSDGQTALSPRNLRFASLSKLVYYEGTNEKLRIGCREFHELSNPIEKPSEWDGQIYHNYTTVRKINDTNFYLTKVNSVKKAEKTWARWDSFSTHIVLEKIISSSSTNFDSIEDFTGELGSEKYEDIREKLKEADKNSVLATDYKMAMIKFPDDNLIAKETKWAITSASGEFISNALAPELFKGVSKVGFKATAVTAVVFGAVDIGIGAYKYANADNPILKRQYAEEMWSAGLSIGLNLIPGYIFVDLGTKVIVYAVEFIVGWPENVDIGTLADPAALIVFAVEYLIPGTIPSGVAKLALKDACNIHGDLVNLWNMGRIEGEPMYLFIPPS